MAPTIWLDKTAFYLAWFDTLKDEKTKSRIRNRLERIEEDGNFGDCAKVGEGVLELRFHFGPGWRIYLFQAKPGLYWVLCGGTKDTQQEDVKLAKSMKEQLERDHARN